MKRKAGAHVRVCNSISVSQHERLRLRLRLHFGIALLFGSSVSCRGTCTTVIFCRQHLVINTSARRDISRHTWKIQKARNLKKLSRVSSKRSSLPILITRYSSHPARPNKKVIRAPTSSETRPLHRSTTHYIATRPVRTGAKTQKKSCLRVE